LIHLQLNNGLAEVTKAIESGGSSANVIIAYSNRGLAHAAKAEYALAIEDYKAALALNPEYVKAYSNLGIAYYHGKEYDAAIENLAQAIERLSKITVLDPDEIKTFLNSLYYRGLSYRAARKYYSSKLGDASMWI
jgi:tetratricopeptide (TPR) repeat protein